VFGDDHFKTYSPVAKFTFICTVLEISAQLDLKVRQMDVDTVFYNADILGNIWVQLPKGTSIPGGDDGVYKLKKCLYGLNQAPREWNHMVNNFLISK
jgi:Reverse transcriptase (RNA-dependent DNA polymerase)